MDKETIKKAIEELEKNKRNFKQTYDLIFVFKNLDVKKQPLEFFANLPHQTGKKVSTCALVGPELEPQAKENCDKVILADDFEKYDKKQIKKLAEEHEYFIAQANLMAKVATTFGRVLGSRGKMPNPKAGCVVPPTANLKALVAKLKKTMKITAKTTPMIQLAVGKQGIETQQITENAHSIYDQIVHHLPNGINNLRKVMIKLTMSKPIRLE